MDGRVYSVLKGWNNNLQEQMTTYQQDCKHGLHVQTWPTGGSLYPQYPVGMDSTGEGT